MFINLHISFLFVSFSLTLTHFVPQTLSVPDIVGNWSLIEQTHYAIRIQSLCPTSIRHTAYKALSKTSYAVAHTSISVNNMPCFAQNETKRFMLYDSRNYRPDLSPYNTQIQLPSRMRTIMASTGPNINALRANFDSNHPFFIGFEPTNRFCGSNTLTFFPEGTTAFLMQPLRPMRINLISTKLTPVKNYLLMIPRFQAVSCLYSAPITAIQSHPTTNSNSSQNSTIRNKPDLQNQKDTCFPSSSLVTLRNGSHLPISELCVGDEVLVDQNSYSTVFAFSHRHEHLQSLFYVLRTSCGKLVSATKGHFIYADNRLLPIERIHIGQMLRTVNGESQVISIHTQVSKGIYNPQTLHGNIVVNGIIASTYTKSLTINIAHAALTPLRAFSRICAVDVLDRLLSIGLRQFPGRDWIAPGRAALPLP